MSATITQAFVQQWDNAIRLQAQQKESRLESATTDRGTITGESFTANRLAPLEDTPENFVRHGDTTWGESTHTTRVALMRDFYQALPVDRADREKLLVNPNGSYSESLTAAWNRRKDNIIFGAITGNSQDKAGAAQTIATNAPGNVIAAGGTGFTITKIIQARSIFRQREADGFAGEELYITYNYKMMQDILADTTLTRADYMAAKMLQDGDVSSKWMGFNWIPYEGITSTSGGTPWTTAAWCKSAVHKGTGFVEGKAQTRADKKDTWQVSMAGSFGAVRTEEEKVVTIAFT